MLLTFSKAGELPMSKIGERLMVHPTSVTNTVNRGIEDGWFTGEIAKSAFQYQRALEKGDKRVVASRVARPPARSPATWESCG
ncbi:hypothetical protein SMICM304S_06137 [Streptomyces microflavus]